MNIKLIVGLGNPGAQYERTRHNAGFEFVDELARQHNGQWQKNVKYHGETCVISLANQKVWLLKPDTFMNRSGSAVAPLANFFKWSPEEILVAHDELDLPPGVSRFKLGGGHGGHNGLKDIISQLANNKNFYRLRIGIGHPGHARDVANFVLSKASTDEQISTNLSSEEALKHVSKLVLGDSGAAMQGLHSFRAVK